MTALNSEYTPSRVTRILTTDFPNYFALITRIKQDVQTVGPDGGVLNSTVCQQVQALFPAGSLTKRIRVGLQVKRKRKSASGKKKSIKTTNTNDATNKPNLLSNLFTKSKKLKAANDLDASQNENDQRLANGDDQAQTAAAVQAASSKSPIAVTSPKTASVKRKYFQEFFKFSSGSLS